MTTKLFALEELEKIATSLHIPLWLYGSFAVEILTHEEIHPEGDIDVACEKLRDYKVLLSVLPQHGYTLVTASKWKASEFGNAYNAKLRSQSGVEIDISYIKGEIGLHYTKNYIPDLEHVRVFTFSPADLLKMYKNFGERNPRQNTLKIELLERVIEKTKEVIISSQVV